MFFKNHRYFYIVFLVSLSITYWWTNDSDSCSDCNTTTDRSNPFPVESSVGLENDFEPQLNQPQTARLIEDPPQPNPRPRFHATELGIRRKLMVAVLVHPDDVESTIDGINRTTAHLVDNIAYFVNTDDPTDEMLDKGIQTFPEHQREWPSFHMIKYISNHYLEKYDFFLVLPATTYVDSRTLVERLGKISVRQEIYMGTNFHGSDHSEDKSCDFDAGILFSNNVLSKLRGDIDQCADDPDFNTDSENIWNCVQYATKIQSCQTEWKGVQLNSYRLHENHQGVYRDFYKLARIESFNNAILIHPLKSADDFFRIHMYLSRVSKRWES